MNRLARAVLILSVAGVGSLFGCIPGEIIDSAHDQPDSAALEPGSYWVIASAPGLDLFQMPAHRGDSGKWQSVADVPEWFTQEGLYFHGDAGDWNLEITGAETDLDELLQVWDPAPAPQ